MRKILCGPKVYLRLIEREDLAKRVAWINDPAVQATLNFDYPTSLARTQKWFEGIVQDKTRLDFSVCLLDSQEYIGIGGIVNIDHRVKKAELYFTIGNRDQWGKGSATEALILLTNYGFIELGLNRVYGYYNADNGKTSHITQKIGWKQEGTFRQDLVSHGKIHDRNVVAILKKEWENNPVYDI
ncbi:MAG: GNAT family protein [Smithellaceae bacterium]